MPPILGKRAAFKSGVRWYSLWDPKGNRVGYERHVVSSVSDGSATVETLFAVKGEKGLSEGVATLAFGTGGARLESVRYQRDGDMTCQIRRNGDVFSGTWAGQPFSKPLPADFMPNFGNAEWVATLPQEPRGLWPFSRLPMGADTPAPASIECVSEMEVKIGGKPVRAWHFVERVSGNIRNQFWITADRTVVKINFGLEAHLEPNEAAARGPSAAPKSTHRPTSAGIAGFDDPTKIGAPGMSRQSSQIGVKTDVIPGSAQPPARPPSQAPPSRVPGALPPGVADSPSRLMRDPGSSPPPPPPVAGDRRPTFAIASVAGMPDHVLPTPTAAPTRELGVRAAYKKSKWWFSLWKEGKPVGWETHSVNPTADGALLETLSHYLGADNKWHDSAAVVVFGANDRVANCHFMQDGIQTELGQPFFTLRHIETGFIGTWQGKPYKRALPDDFVPGFGLHQWIATFPQAPGARRAIQRLAMAQTELAPCTIECHGEHEVDVKGRKEVLCKFVERIGDRARSIWWVDRDRCLRKHFFGLDAVLEADEAAAKEAGMPKEEAAGKSDRP